MTEERPPYGEERKPERPGIEHLNGHTPGPWFVWDTDGADFTVIATRPKPERAPSSASDEEVLGTSEWLRAKPEDIALMAAAPALLAEVCRLRSLVWRIYSASPGSIAALAGACPFCLGDLRNNRGEHKATCPWLGIEAEVKEQEWDARGR